MARNGSRGIAVCVHYGRVRAACDAEITLPRSVLLQLLDFYFTVTASVPANTDMYVFSVDGSRCYDTSSFITL